MVTNQASDIIVRPSSPDDEAFVLATAERLVAFPPPPWRTPREIVAGEARTLAAHFRTPTRDATCLVAQDAAGAPLGFAFLEVVQDYFTAEHHGHIGILAVGAEHEGVGVGRALLDAAERWASARGFRRLTLNVFDANQRARAVYEHVGYRPETLRYVKTLTDVASTAE